MKNTLLAEEYPTCDLKTVDNPSPYLHYLFALSVFGRRISPPVYKP